MSGTMRPVQTYVTVCELCDKPIDSGDPYQRAELITAYQATRPIAHPVKHWIFRWNPQSWPGRRGPSWQQAYDDPKRWGDRVYDFHGECLLRVVEAAIETTRPTPTDPKEA